jgi:hypothetical protein
VYLLRRVDDKAERVRSGGGDVETRTTSNFYHQHCMSAKAPHLGLDGEDWEVGHSYSGDLNQRFPRAACCSARQSVSELSSVHGGREDHGSTEQSLNYKSTTVTAIARNVLPLDINQITIIGWPITRFKGQDRGV